MTSTRLAKLIRSLSQKKFREKERLFVVEGTRFISDIPPTSLIVAYAFSTTFDKNNKNFTRRTGVDFFVYPDREFDALCDTVTPQGALAVCAQISQSCDIASIPLTGRDTFIVLDGIKDPGNMGTIIRTADAAGVSAIFAATGTVDIYNPKTLRSTMGSIFNIPIYTNIPFETIVNALRVRGVTIIGTHLESSIFYYNVDYNKNTAIIIGGEASGISNFARDSADLLTKIPIQGTAESLNAAVAAAVIMYEALRQKV